MKSLKKPGANPDFFYMGPQNGHLNEKVRRNIDRFPGDFMFELTKDEYTNLKSQIATSSSHHGGRRKLPLAFTEHGAVMLAGVLNSRKINALEGRYDRQFRAVFDATRQLMDDRQNRSRSFWRRDFSRLF